MSTKTTRKSAAASAASQQASVSSPQVSTSKPEKSSTPLSPARVTRMQEKLELQNLNDRLAAYIDRVRFLETENSRLSVQVQTTQETVTREVSSIKSLYEQELSDARKALDETAKDKARLQIECSKWKNQLDEIQQKFSKKEKDLTAAEKKLVNFETHNQDLQSRLNQAQAEKKRLEEALKEAESERDKLAKQLAASKSQLEEEAIYRVDLLNKIQSVKEELSFKESIHEKELSETRVLTTTDISDIDLNLKEQFEQKLADTLRELRDQYETQMRINRDEVESIYETKIADLQRILDNSTHNAQNKTDELRSFKSKYDQMQSKMSELASQHDSLKNRIRDLEALLEQEREWHNMALQSKDNELKALREDVERQLQEYQDLLDIKVALDMEIAAYRKLLEVEETRLHITPLKSPEARSTPIRRTPMRGKRKRTVFQSGETSTSDSQVTASAKSDVEVHDHDIDGKFIKLYNKGTEDIHIGGWQLVRKAGEQETIFKFHRTVVIKAASYVTVWSSDTGVSHNPPSDLVMKGQKWFTAESISSTLLNNNGEEMAVRETSKKFHSASEQRIFDPRSYFSSTRFSGEEIYHQQGDPENPQERCVIM